MTTNKFILATTLIASLACASCIDTGSNASLERQIKSHVLSEAKAIATLEATYIIVFDHIKNSAWYDPRSNNVYIEKDEAKIDYGFTIEENSIKVLDGTAKKILQVRLAPGKKLGTDRIELSKDKTHHDYVPVDENGHRINISAEINKKLAAAEQMYAQRHLEKAAENIKNFFTIVAAKYDLELDFAISSN